MSILTLKSNWPVKIFSILRMWCTMLFSMMSLHFRGWPSSGVEQRFQPNVYLSRLGVYQFDNDMFILYNQYTGNLYLWTVDFEFSPVFVLARDGRGITFSLIRVHQTVDWDTPNVHQILLIFGLSSAISITFSGTRKFCPWGF